MGLTIFLKHILKIKLDFFVEMLRDIYIYIFIGCCIFCGGGGCGGREEERAGFD